MEETVGAFWHKLITGAAEQRYPQEAVTLESISKTAGIFFRALGGDSGLSVRATGATEHGARRSLLQRIAGSGEKAELTWVDENTLRLPAVLDILPQRSLNRDLYLWLIALAAVDEPDTPSWVVRSQQATLTAFDRFPGIRSRYRRLLDATLALRPDPAKLPEDEAAMEQAIRAALANPGSVDKSAAAPGPPVAAPQPAANIADSSRQRSAFRRAAAGRRRQEQKNRRHPAPPSRTGGHAGQQEPVHAALSRRKHFQLGRIHQGQPPYRG
jgi:nitric oxide reductase NorD protein